MIDFIFHSFPCKIYNFYAFTVIYPSQKKDIELELELVLQREKERPDNQGVSVKMDYRRRCVMVGDHVVEKGNFHYGPEM